MEGLTFLQLPLGPTIKSPRVAAGAAVIQTPGEVINVASITSGCNEVSSESSSSKDQITCLLCFRVSCVLQGGRGENEIPSGTKLSAIEFCNLINVSVPSLPKNALRKCVTPFCEKCLEDVVKIRGLLNQIGELEQSLIITRNLLKDKVVANFGTQKDCDTRQEDNTLAEIYITIRNSILKDVSERTTHSVPSTTDTALLPHKKRGRKPGKKLPSPLQIPETEYILPTTLKESTSRKSSFGRVVKRPRYYMMSDDEGCEETDTEKKHDTDLSIAHETALAPDLTIHSENDFGRVEVINFGCKQDETLPGRQVSSKPGTETVVLTAQSDVVAVVQAISTKIKSKGIQVKNGGEKGHSKKRQDDKKLQKKKSTSSPQTSVHLGGNIDDGVGKLEQVGLLNKDNTDKSNQEVVIQAEEQQKETKKDKEKNKKTKVPVPKNRKCEVCNIMFKDIRDRNRHVMRLHQGLHQDFECKGCDKSFNNLNELMRHRELEHPPKEPMLDDATGRRVFQCDLCKTLFKHYYDLQIHHRTHTGERPFKCHIDHCNEAFISKGRYEAHVELKHPAKAPLKCEYCPRSYFRHHRLRDHKKSHTGERPYLCEICSKAFSQPAYLKYHQTQHKELNLAEFKCDECEKKFASPVNLKFHRETQHQKKYRYHCSICGYGATHQSHLKQHMLDHTGERPYICTEEHCQKSFKRASQLKIHIRGHTGEKPYVCKLCDKGFTNSSRLRRHELTHTTNKVKKRKQQNNAKATQPTGEGEQNPEHSATATLTAATNLAGVTGILLPTDLVDVQVEEDTNGQAVLKLEHVPSTLTEQEIQQQLITLPEHNGLTYQIISTDEATGNESYTEYILINSNYTFS